MSSNDNHQKRDGSEESSQEGSTYNSASISRRKFLGYLGATTLGAVASTLPISSALAKTMASEKAERDAILRTATSSPMFKTALAELTAKGFGFDLARINIDTKHEHAGFYAVTLRNVTSKQEGAGAEIITRYDRASQSVDGLEYLHGMSGDKALTVRSTMLSLNGGRLDNEQTFPRAQASNPGRDGVDSCTPYYWKECCCWGFVGCNRMGCCLEGSTCYSSRCIEVYEVGSCRECTRNIDCSINCDPWHYEGRYRINCNVCCE